MPLCPGAVLRRDSDWMKEPYALTSLCHLRAVQSQGFGYVHRPGACFAQINKEDNVKVCFTFSLVSTVMAKY